MNDMESIGEKINPILEEIETTLWEFEANVGLKPNYPKNAIASATKIFMSVLLDKMFELQEYEKLILEDRINMAQKLGEEIRRLVKVYTNIDTYDFYK